MHRHNILNLRLEGRERPSSDILLIFFGIFWRPFGRANLAGRSTRLERNLHSSLPSLLLSSILTILTLTCSHSLVLLYYLGHALPSSQPPSMPPSALVSMERTLQKLFEDLSTLPFHQARISLHNLRHPLLRISSLQL